MLPNTAAGSTHLVLVWFFAPTRVASRLYLAGVQIAGLGATPGALSRTGHVHRALARAAGRHAHVPMWSRRLARVCVVLGSGVALHDGSPRVAAAGWLRPLRTAAGRALHVCSVACVAARGGGRPAAIFFYSRLYFVNLGRL